MSAASPERGRQFLDEALRLLDVAQAAHPGSGRERAASGLDERAAAECFICPVCRGIAVLRELDPQAVERLTGAVADVAGAVRELFGVPARPAGPAGAGARSGAEAGDEDRAHGGDEGGDRTGGDEGGDRTGGGGAASPVNVQQIDVTD